MRAPVAAAGLGAALAVLGAAGFAAAGQGYERAPDAVCPPRAPSAASAFPARAGRESMLIPVGYQASASLSALVCRYTADSALAGGTQLDAARTARLVGVLAEPAGGWPADALTAKRAAPMTPDQLAAASAPACGARTASAWVVVRYVTGPDAAVLVRGEPCRDATNGVIRLRVSAQALAATTA